MASMATSEQIDLLGRIQGLGHFKSINPLSMTEDQADDIFKSLPALELIEVEAVDLNGTRHYAEFIGVSEYDTKKQSEKWLDNNDYIIEHKSQPQFGHGIMWLDYFRQPVEQVNLKALEKAFSEWGLETSPKRFLSAFEGMTPEKFKEIQESRASREQYAILRAYVSQGKMEKLEKEDYMTLTQRDANELIDRYRDVPPAIDLEKNTCSNAFPELKASNLISENKADYIQLSIVRDLAASGYLCQEENRKEFLDKIKFMTAGQAENIIKEYGSEPAGETLLLQLKTYIEAGKIVDWQKKNRSVLTVADIKSVFETYRERDYVRLGIVKDLIEDGHLGGNKDVLLEKAKFLTSAQVDEIISKHGGERIGRNLVNQLRDIVDAGKIGDIDAEKWKNMSIREGRNILAQVADIDKAQMKMTVGQKNLLQKLADANKIDLSKVDMDKLTFCQAKQLISAGIEQQNERAATVKQRNLLRQLVGRNLLPAIPYAEWKNMSVKTASEKISSVPKTELERVFSMLQNDKSLLQRRHDGISR